MSEAGVHFSKLKLCQGWSVGVAGGTATMTCVRTGLSVYAGSTMTDGLCQDWSVSAC